MTNRFSFLSFVFVVVLASSCGQKDSPKNDTILKGEMTLLVDETILPIVQEEIEIFESQYPEAKIKLDPKSEAEVIQILANDTSRVAILARKLNAKEEQVFAAKKITPKATKFATDAIALITNKNTTDTLIDLQAVLDVLQQKTQTNSKDLIFDNPNSSTASYLNNLAGIAEFPKEGVFSFKTNEETIKHVAGNNGVIGIVGLNWLANPSTSIKPYVDQLHILSVKGKSGDYSYPSQNDIAEGKYPLARDLYVVNCQGYPGLGMGLGTFFTSQTGQRIILKSGLVPAKTPARKILIRQEIEKTKK